MNDKLFYHAIKCGKCGRPTGENPNARNEKHCEHGLRETTVFFKCRFCRADNPQKTYTLDCVNCDQQQAGTNGIRKLIYSGHPIGVSGTLPDGTAYKLLNVGACHETDPCSHDVSWILSGSGSTITIGMSNESIYDLLQQTSTPQNYCSLPREHFKAR